MRKILLAQEATPTPGPIPPIEDIFACITPRITGKDPIPRVSCMIGEEGETIKIECLWPRVACLMGIRKGEGGLITPPKTVGKREVMKHKKPSGLLPPPLPLTKLPRITIKA